MLSLTIPLSKPFLSNHMLETSIVISSLCIKIIHYQLQIGLRLFVNQILQLIIEIFLLVIAGLISVGP